MKNTLKTIQTFSKVGKILSKIAFVFSVIGFCGCVAGLLCAALGGDSALTFDGITIHGLLSGIEGMSRRGVCAYLAGRMILCAGEAVAAWFAGRFFTHELEAGTPFTHDGARELLRLGILTAAVAVGCTALGEIVAEIVAGEEAVAGNLGFSCASSIALGVMFAGMSLLCRLGAEQKEQN